MGDVLLNNLKQQIEAAGVTVEFRLTGSGGVLICGSQVSVTAVALLLVLGSKSSPARA